jgi:hypothetical protein
LFLLAKFYYPASHCVLSATNPLLLPAYGCLRTAGAKAKCTLKTFKLGATQVIDRLPSKCETPSSSPIPPKINK